MAMDITKIILSLFLVSTGSADTTGPDCPSNTVEIVFTKNGVICATTSSVPELNHLSVDPKHIPNLLGEPPIVQKVSIPVLTHSIMGAPQPSQHLILPQVPVSHMQMLGQPIPAQPMLVQPSAVEFMVRRLPLYHENIINQNLDYIDRRPDLMEDKRFYYQKMLWEKLRRDAFIKKLVRNNPNQLFGVQYIDENNNNHQNNDLPEKTAEEQSQTLPQNPQNTQIIEENTEPEEKPLNEHTSQEEQTFEEQSNTENTNNNDYNDNQNQEQIDSNANTNQKEQLLKNYLMFLNKKEDIPQEGQNTESQRDRRQYDIDSSMPESSSTNPRVPDIIKGYMPEAPISTNGHTFGMKIQKTPVNEYVSDEPEVSQSQVSYQFVRPNSFQYNQNLMQSLRFPQNEDTDKSLRLVSTGMTFGNRVNPKETEPLNIGYGYKSYPEYNEDKAKRFRTKSKFLDQPVVKEWEPIEEDVVLVTADPKQRQFIETLEEQNIRRNQRKFNNDWTGSQGLGESNAINYLKNKDFIVDETRIEYNGWRPLRLHNRQSEQSEDKPQEGEVIKPSSSQKVISILPITGRIDNKWTAI